MGAGAIVAIVLGSIVGVIVLLGIVGAVISDDTKEASSSKPTRTSTAKPAPAPEPTADATIPDNPVKLYARKTTFKPSVLHDGGKYTSVTVTIQNNGDEPISSNPLYFTITDTTGAKHAAELGADDNQMDVLKLAPGEKATGVITGKGSFIPAYVTYTDGLFGDGVRANVS
ncbi:DUF4352 domain-containing protein [Streptomyces sp. NPDC056056]|uniref:DUF4352 domain-containing protein n=1 Tax=Streptomyces sp. NPDC056056 TaxID=3345698 RepID=UPI0035DA7664